MTALESIGFILITASIGSAIALYKCRRMFLKNRYHGTGSLIKKLRENGLI